ncbi:MAG TPA: MarR family winged helix-turn-helix transcriptional regulator [Cytophagaceae bacterium]|jgi:DNA-binding MarR family transcriptional regulator|nr:MarR family winged helix-turn-helix transcriptional regulator [Cytophagaceae bacterium]
MSYYNKIAALIQKWGEYENLYPNPELADFGKWLSTQNQKEKTPDAIEKKQDMYYQKWSSYEEGLKHHHEMKSKEVQIGMLVGRLSKYGRIYAKKALHHLEMNLDEFTFLAAVLHLNNPKKTDVINLNLFEPTSGTEILRRLIKLKYIKESINKEDKRSKLLKLTALGEKTIFKAFEQMTKVGTLLSANLSEKQKIELISMMDYLNGFHVHLYLNHKEESVEEILKKYLGTT